MHTWIKNVPIKTKLVLIILFCCVIGLALEGFGLIAYEHMRVREEMVRDLSSLARIVADRNTAALSFNDDKIALETLAALKAKRDITAAAIYDASGKVFAGYNSGEERPYLFPDGNKLDDQVRVDEQHIHLVEPIVMDGAPIGKVFIRASLRELDRLWQKFLAISALIALLTVLITLFVAARLQRLVSGPVERLTDTAQQISGQKNYSLRATQESNDEVGALVKAFNGMLEAIETRNHELLHTNQRLAESEGQLQRINEDLEQRVEERTRGLRMANDEMKAILDSAGFGIAFINDRQIQRCNRRVEEMFGWAPGEIIGQSTRVIYPSDEAYASLGMRGYPIIATGETFVSEEILRRKDGSTFWGQLSGHAVDPADPACGSVWLMEDITERRRAAEELREAKEIAEEATETKSMFLANMSHEIRTPMNAIIGMLYLALKTDLTPRQRNFLSKAQGSANSLMGIINDILDISKIEAGKMEIESIEFGLDTVLERLTDSVGFQAEQKGVEFLIRYDVNIPPTLIGDPLRIGQVLLNLCSNAIKFTEVGEVELAFRCLSSNETDLTLQISVRDTGIGMTPDMQHRLFQKFTQADQSTTRRFGGTGLGLAISKHLIELMGGRIWLEDSQPDKGTTICCTIQLKVAQQAQLRRRELLGQAGPLLEGIRVLVVDDNEVSRDILAGMLRFFHLGVSVAANGKAAIDLLETTHDKPFDLVLMDWRMPGMNGDEAIRRIHADIAITHQPKMVMVTAYGREDVIKLADQAGVDGFLIKPVSPSTLLDTILSVLGRGRIFSANGEDRTESNAIASHDFSGAHLLLVEDNEINREFAVELLRSMNIQVDEAVNGEEAVKMVEQRAYDAVLMDIQMPVMGGLEAAQCIRLLAQQPGGERFASLPIIAMTALAMASDAERSQQAGMNDHITKPIDPDRLMATLAKWLQIEKNTAAQTSSDKAGAELTPGYPGDLLALKNMDAVQGIRRIGGNAEAYRKQLRRFRENYSSAADELQRLTMRKGVQAGAEYCHALKGVFGNLGADALFASAVELDALLKQGKMPGPEQMERLRQLLQQAMNEIDGLVAPVTAMPIAGATLDRGELPAKLAALSSLLQEDLGAAELLLMELRSGVAGTGTEQPMAEIAAMMDVFAIDEAQIRIAALLDRLGSVP